MLEGAIISFVHSGNEASRPDDIVCGTLTGSGLVSGQWITLTCTEEIAVAAEGPLASGIIKLTVASGKTLMFCGMKVHGIYRDTANASVTS